MKEFLRAGHWPTLVAALLHFETSFMLWVLMGALGVVIAEDLGLSATEKGLMAGIPLLGGALFRVPVGLLSDRVGPKPVGLATMLAVLLPLALAWRVVADFGGLLLVGLLLGVAGASFAVALPLAGQAYRPGYQGLAMGIAGAGNSGVILASFLAPRLAEVVGWQGVFGLALIPAGAAGALFALLARCPPVRPLPDSRGHPQQLEGADSGRLFPLRVAPPRGRWSEEGQLFRQGDLWWFCLLYSMTFGGYVGLSSFLGIYFHDEFRSGAVTAGALVAACAAAGSLLRPVGGGLADRFGGLRVLAGVYATVPLALLAPMVGGPLPVTFLSLLAAMGCLGMGNGAVFQLVPQRFDAHLGLATGIIGAAGGLGGFLLPALLGLQRDVTGSYGPAFAMYALSLVYMFLCLKALETGWRFTWLPSVRAEGR